MKIKSFIIMLLIFTFINGTALADTPGLIYKNKYTSDDGFTYYLQRVYDGIPVYKEGVYITFDKDGNLIYLHDNVGEGTFEKSMKFIDLEHAINNITFDVLKPYYIKNGTIYRYVLKPDEFAIDANNGKLTRAENEKIEIDGDAEISWENENAIKELENILGQAGYSYTKKNYKEFNDSQNVTYISGNKKFSYLNLAIHEGKPISIAYSAMYTGKESKDISIQKAIAKAQMLYRQIVPEGNTAQMSSYETEKDYRVDFIRTEKGIPVDENGFNVIISKDGFVKSINYRWDQIDFERAYEVDESNILSRFIEAAEIGLYYKKTGDKYIPVYTASKDIDYITPQGSVYFQTL